LNGDTYIDIDFKSIAREIVKMQNKVACVVLSPRATDDKLNYSGGF